MATNEWFEMTDGCIERKNGETIVYDEEGNEMFRLDWEAGINQVVSSRLSLTRRTVLVGWSDRTRRSTRCAGCWRSRQEHSGSRHGSRNRYKNMDPYPGEIGSICAYAHARVDNRSRQWKYSDGT